MKSCFHAAEQDSISCSKGWPNPEELLHHGGVSGISDALVDIAPDEIEKGGELRVSDTSCLQLCPISYFPKGAQDLLGGEIIEVSLPESLEGFNPTWP